MSSVDLFPLKTNIKITQERLADDKRVKYRTLLYHK